MHQGPKPKRIHQTAIFFHQVYIHSNPSGTIWITNFCGASVLMQRISEWLTSSIAGLGGYSKDHGFFYPKKSVQALPGNTWSNNSSTTVYGIPMYTLQ